MSFIPIFLNSLQTILKDTSERIQSPHDEALEGGVWYSVEYYRALNRRNKQGAIDKLRNQNAFFQGMIPSAVASRLRDDQSPTGYAPVSFIIQKSAAPSLALQTIEEGLSFLDCSTVVMLSLYKALYLNLGQEKFDFLFSASSPFAFELSSRKSSPLNRLLGKHLISSEADIQVGDICYFSNIKDYVAKHPIGESRGDHVVCLSSKPHLYTGFGLPYLGLDKDGVESELWDCYNRSPASEELVKAPIWNYLCSYYYEGDILKGKALVASFKESTLSFEEFSKRPARAQILGHPCQGKLGLWVYRVRQDLIEKLVASKPETIIDIFFSFLL